MTDRKKSLAGHGVVFVTMALFMLGTMLNALPHLVLLCIGIVAGVWGGLGPANGKRGALLLALANVLLVNVAFWFILLVIVNPPGHVHQGMRDEGLSLLAVFMAPVSILLVMVSYGMARLGAKMIQRRSQRRG